MATVEDIKRRVRALIAKKNGGTEAEIASALAMAKKLMGEWALTEADIKDRPAETGVTKAAMKPRTAPPLWETNIGLICMELFSVHAYANDLGDNKSSLCFVGFPADVELSIELFTILKAQILKLGAEYQRAVKCTYGERCRFSFGVVHRLVLNIMEAKQSAKDEDDAKCRGLVLAKKEIVTEWVNKNLKLYKEKKRIAHDVHFEQGVNAASKIDMGMRQKVESRY